MKKRTVYRPKIVTAKVKDTGWPIDGYTLLLSLWDYDNREQWHLYDWPDEADKAIMETMFATEKEAGMNLYDTLEEFSEHWKEWEAQGSFCIPLDNAEILKVIQEESRTN